MKGEFEKFTYSDAATKGLFIYDLKTGKTRRARQQQAAPSLHAELVAGRQLVRGHGARRHGLLATTSWPSRPTATRSFDLKLNGCRPNISPDGKKVCWGHGDYCAGVADLDFSGPTPKATNIHRRGREQGPDRDLSHHLVAGHEISHLHARAQVQGQDLKGLLPEFPGVEAPGWNVCVADATQKNRWVAITTDGKSCKQPSWVVVKEGAAK